MVYHYTTGGRRNSYLIKYFDNIMIYRYIGGKKKFLIKYSDNVMIYHYITGRRRNFYLTRSFNVKVSAGVGAWRKYW